MNKNTLVTISSILIALSAVSCKNQADDLSRKWKMTEMVVAGQKLDGEAVAGFSLTLEKSGSYKIVAMQEDEGTWEVKNDSLMTKSNRNQWQGSKIEKLTAEELVLVSTSEGADMKLVFAAETK